MIRSNISTFSFLLLLALTPACSEDDPAAPEPDNSVLSREPLTSRNAVLNNIEYAYGNLQADVIDELLDSDFTFFLSAADVADGLTEYWTREDEMQVTMSMFASSTRPAELLIRSMRVDIRFDEAEWSSFVPPSAPGETWYTTTLFYTFTVEIEPDITLVAIPGSKAEFVVREDATGSGTEWRLVEWHDLGASLASATRGAAAVSESTWGKVKELFRESELLALTSKNAVLNNIEQSYNERRTDAFDELLDVDFAFFFSPGDVGGEIPEQWARADELDATSRWFFSNQQAPPPMDPVCTSIAVNLTYNPSTITWVEIVPEDFPTETWYSTTVFYAFTFEMEPDITYLASPGSKAQFTVRPVEVGARTEFRLVEWRDLGSNLIPAANGSETTWGRIKALYR